MEINMLKVDECNRQINSYRQSINKLKNEIENDINKINEKKYQIKNINKINENKTKEIEKIEKEIKELEENVREYKKMNEQIYNAITQLIEAENESKVFFLRTVF